jgi:hypothetical protein
MPRPTADCADRRGRSGYSDGQNTNVPRFALFYAAFERAGTCRRKLTLNTPPGPPGRPEYGACVSGPWSATPGFCETGGWVKADGLRTKCAETRLRISMCRFALNPPACPAAHTHTHTRARTHTNTHRDRQPEAEGLSINRPMLIYLARDSRAIAIKAHHARENVHRFELSTSRLTPTSAHDDAIR